MIEVSFQSLHFLPFFNFLDDKFRNFQEPKCFGGFTNEKCQWQLNPSYISRTLPNGRNSLMKDVERILSFVDAKFILSVYTGLSRDKKPCWTFTMNMMRRHSCKILQSTAVHCGSVVTLWAFFCSQSYSLFALWIFAWARMCEGIEWNWFLLLFNFGGGLDGNRQAIERKGYTHSDIVKQEKYLIYFRLNGKNILYLIDFQIEGD